MYFYQTIHSHDRQCCTYFTYYSLHDRVKIYFIIDITLKLYTDLKHVYKSYHSVKSTRIHGSTRHEWKEGRLKFVYAFVMH